MPRYDVHTHPEFRVETSRVINLDTGTDLTFHEDLIWCDTDTGEYERYVRDEDGKFIMDMDSPSGFQSWDENGKPLYQDVRARTFKGKARLRVEFFEKAVHG